MERYGSYIVSAELVAAAKVSGEDLTLYTSADGDSVQITIRYAAAAWASARATVQPPAPGWTRIASDTWANFARYAICDLDSGHAYTPEGTRVTLSPDAMAAVQSLLASLPDQLAG